MAVMRPEYGSWTYFSQPDPLQAAIVGLNHWESWESKQLGSSRNEANKAKVSGSSRISSTIFFVSLTYSVSM